MTEQQTTTNEQTPPSGAATQQGAANGSAAQAAASVQASAQTKPEGLSDKYFDTTAGVKWSDLTKDFGSLEAFKAQADLKAGLVPEKADGYAVKLPGDFKAPDGVEIKIDEKDPRVAAARAVAHEFGLSQDQFSKLLTIEAERVIGEQQQYQELHGMFVKSLGANGQERIDRIATVVNTMADKETAADVMGMMVTKRGVEFMERLLAKNLGSGVGTPGQNGRTAPNGSEDARVRAMYPSMRS